MEINFEIYSIILGIVIGIFLGVIVALFRRKKHTNLLELEKLILEGSMHQKTAYEKMGQLFKIVKKAQQLKE